MSNLVKPYEITVWDDEWSKGQNKFVEKRLATIGSDKMKSQNKVIEPVLTSNVNGTKKLTFKMCKRYRDNVTGKVVDNPLSSYLISERKIKLEYDGQWYDFIIKNISEDSAQYVFSYTCEDALVQELSKNGFGVVLDQQLQNNSDTIGNLASYVLSDTDWEVDLENSDVGVQTIDEALVYLKVKKESGVDCTRIFDPQEMNGARGGITQGESKTIIGSGSIVLAYYSSCKDRPYHFQFVYIKKPEDEYGREFAKRDLIAQDENRIIKEPNCQYFITIPDPDDATEGYQEEETTYGFYLPHGFELLPRDNDATDATDSTISSWYRSARYVMGAQTKFEPKLERYVNVYKKIEKDENGKPTGVQTEYYGYATSECVSPEIVTNIITNYDFNSTSGWTGTYYEKDASTLPRPQVTNLFGQFSGNTFVSSIEFDKFDMDGSNSNLLNPANNKSFLKIEMFDYEDGKDGSKSVVSCESGAVIINSGPFDNRTSLKNMEVGSEWALRILNQIGESITDSLTPKLVECSWDKSTQSYKDKSTSESKNLVEFDDFSKDTDGYWIAKVKSNTYGDDAERFKKYSQVRLVLHPGLKQWVHSEEIPATHYISKIELFRVIRDNNGKIITPEQVVASDGKWDPQAFIKQKHFYYTKEQIDAVSDPKNFTPITYEKADNKTYVPQHLMNAEKIRSISAKESNYFNILQSLAETFEMWLILDVERDKFGTPIHKKVKFKHTIGKQNYANFRYGVNLKDIKRTYESKALVTKLIVKDNTNQYAENGFCTIARAAANPIAENYLYDFSYYFNTNLMNARDHLDAIYSTKDSKGLDDLAKEKINIPKNATDFEVAELKAETNSLGYYPRLSALNKKIDELADQILEQNTGLTKLKADLEVAENAVSAAKTEMEDLDREFYETFGVSLSDYKDLLKQKNVIKWNDSITADQNTSNYTVDIKNIDGNKVFTSNGTDYYGLRMFFNGGYTEICYYTKQKEEYKVYQSTWEQQWPQESLQTITFPSSVEAQNFINDFNSQVYNKTGSEKYSFDKQGSLEEGEPKKIEDVPEIQKYLQEYSEYNSQLTSAERDLNGYTQLDGTRVVGLVEKVEKKEGAIEALAAQRDEFLEQKRLLNLAFFQRYARFIQEGTWTSQEYTDDNKYYNDAQSVLYNSCFPKVEYSINVLALSALPGYELFHFELGDRTYVEDPEFFGREYKEEVVLTELVTNLDQPDKNTYKVRNFKDQFQDLFQKITATVQQAQYREGSYEKAAALAEAGQRKKNQFLDDALGDATAMLEAGGQQTVTWGSDGITVVSNNTPSNKLRLIGGTILFAGQDENGVEKWKTGITSKGLSASLITAGKMKAGEVTISNGEWDTFRWDANGLSAFAFDSFRGVPGAPDYSTFVRFDQHGIYGIDGRDGRSWKPLGTTIEEKMKSIDQLSTFCLTWEGLKVTGSDGGVARLGKNGDYIMKVTKGKDDTFFIKADGTISALQGMIGGWKLSTDTTKTKTTFSLVAGDESATEEGSYYMYIGDEGIVYKKVVNKIVKNLFSLKSNALNDADVTCDGIKSSFIYAERLNAESIFVIGKDDENGRGSTFINGVRVEVANVVCSNYGFHVANLDTNFSAISLSMICSNGVYKHKLLKTDTSNSTKVSQVWCYGDSEIATMDNITTLKAAITTLQADITTLKADITTLKADITTLKGKIK